MARTALAVKYGNGVTGQLSLAGLEVQGDATDDASFPNDGATLLFVRNAGAGTHALTFDTPGSVGGNAIANPVTGNIAAGAWAVFGPFDRSTYDQSDGHVYWASSGTKTECKYVAVRAT